MISDRELYLKACEARDASYCPYSGISVGAALLTASGKVYTGANIENSAFSPTVCAERVAFFTAIHSGEREFVAIAVAGGERGKPAKPEFPPCGICRQVMSEFCKKDFKIIFGMEAFSTLKELLPHGFDKDFIV
ncbi:MAG: cytidine deaminase [Clostridia bacterium]|nr:cytidine deaminase [Clostridia bacterium]